MESDRRIQINQIATHELIISPQGREGIATPDGSLDYTVEGQDFISGQRDRQNSQDMYPSIIVLHRNKPLGY